MQTFLPYPDFAASARCLDRARLGKQRVEVLQLVTAILVNAESRWRRHPACLMWFGHSGALITYGLAICDEWRLRGYRDSVRDTLADLSRLPTKFADPPWLGDERLHRSHRSNLLRKSPEHYGRFGWTESSDLPYFWPI